MLTLMARREAPSLRMDGTEYQKCPSNFFILCRDIAFICSRKLSPTFLWDSKFDVKLGSGAMISKLPFSHFFKIMPKVTCFNHEGDNRLIFHKIWCQVGEMGYDSHVWPEAFMNMRGGPRLV